MLPGKSPVGLAFRVGGLTSSLEALVRWLSRPDFADRPDFRPDRWGQRVEHVFNAELKEPNGGRRNLAHKIC